jgi:hypothetical protein
MTTYDPAVSGSRGACTYHSGAQYCIPQSGTAQEKIWASELGGPMHRRTFLAAGLGVLLHNTRAPGGDCPNLECRLPAVNPRPFPIAQAGRLERPAATIKRPLWSSLSILEKARAFSTLYKAYRTMASMAPSNPRSLAFQAWLHQYYCCKHPEGSSEIIPGAVRNIHSTSDFLPWHRAFLFFHERIIQSVSGDRNFRLPVWDWESPCGYQAPWAYDPGLLPTGMPCVCEARKEAVYQVNSSVLQGWLQMRLHGAPFKCPHCIERVHASGGGGSRRPGLLRAPRQR